MRKEKRRWARVSVYLKCYIKERNKNVKGKNAKYIGFPVTKGNFEKSLCKSSFDGFRPISLV